MCFSPGRLDGLKIEREIEKVEKHLEIVEQGNLWDVDSKINLLVDSIKAFDRRG